jgi:hypothetical protein
MESDGQRAYCVSNIQTFFKTYMYVQCVVVVSCICFLIEHHKVLFRL